MGWYHAFFIGECRVNAGGGRVFSSWLRCAPLFKLLHDSGCGASSGHPFQWISFFLLGFVFLSFWLHSAVVHIISPVGWNLCPLQWEPRLLTTGPPGEFSFRIFFFSFGPVNISGIPVGSISKSSSGHSLWHLLKPFHYSKAQAVQQNLNLFSWGWLPSKFVSFWTFSLSHEHSGCSLYLLFLYSLWIFFYLLGIIELFLIYIIFSHSDCEAVLCSDNLYKKASDVLFLPLRGSLTLCKL